MVFIDDQKQFLELRDKVAGVTAGAVSINPMLKSETIAEIEPLVPKVVSKYFGAHNYNVVTNPKVHVQIDETGRDHTA